MVTVSVRPVTKPVGAARRIVTGVATGPLDGERFVSVGAMEPFRSRPALTIDDFGVVPVPREEGNFAAFMELLPRRVETLALRHVLEVRHPSFTDPRFAASPQARLEFFYDRSPWGLANRVGESPVGRLLSLDGVPLQ